MHLNVKKLTYFGCIVRSLESEYSRVNIYACVLHSREADHGRIVTFSQHSDIGMVYKSFAYLTNVQKFILNIISLAIVSVLFLR